MKIRNLILAGMGAAAAALLIRRSIKAPAFDFKGKIALITGGSRGLGLVLARELARKGASLALVANDQEELEAAARELERTGATVATIQEDLTTAEGPGRAALQAINRFGRIDLLINNAGIMQVGPLDTMTEKEFERAMSLHYWAPLRMVLECLPHMRRRRSGRIVNISSIGGLVAIPHMLPYCGSKFALVGLSEGLRAELAMDGIPVTTVCPGLMRTGSVNQADFKGRSAEEKNWFGFGASFPGLSLSPEKAALLILEASRKGTPFLTFTAPARLGMIASALFPNTVGRMMGIVNRMLPASNGNRLAVRGSEIPSSLPRWQSRILENAAARNNEQGRASRAG